MKRGAHTDFRRRDRRRSMLFRKIVRAAVASFWGLICWTLSPVSAAAQADSLPRVLDALEPEHRIRVEVRAKPEALVGAFVSRAGESLVLRTPSGERDLRIGDVERLWARAGNHAGRGLLFGTLAGAGAGAVIGAVAVEASNSDAFSRGAGAFVGALAGAVPGLVVGTVIGANTPKWDLRFTAGRPGVAVRVRLP